MHSQIYIYIFIDILNNAVSAENTFNESINIRTYNEINSDSSV